MDLSLFFFLFSIPFRFKNFTIPFSSLFRFLKIKIQLECRINFHTTPLYIYIYIISSSITELPYHLSKFKTGQKVR